MLSCFESHTSTASSFVLVCWLWECSPAGTRPVPECVQPPLPSHNYSTHIQERYNKKRNHIHMRQARGWRAQVSRRNIQSGTMSLDSHSVMVSDHRAFLGLWVNIPYGFTSEICIPSILQACQFDAMMIDYTAEIQSDTSRPYVWEEPFYYWTWCNGF